MNGLFIANEFAKLAGYSHVPGATCEAMAFNSVDTYLKTLGKSSPWYKDFYGMARLSIPGHTKIDVHGNLDELIIEYSRKEFSKVFFTVHCREDFLTQAWSHNPSQYNWGDQYITSIDAIIPALKAGCIDNNDIAYVSDVIESFKSWVKNPTSNGWLK